MTIRRNVDPIEVGVGLLIAGIIVVTVLLSVSGGGSSSLSAGAVESCLKDAGAPIAVTQPNSEAYGGGHIVVAPLPGGINASVLIVNDKDKAKAISVLYASRYTQASTQLSDDGNNVLITPKGADPSAFRTLERCSRP